MGRPPKEGVDYFPHKAKHGETMFVIEQNFGNDGYATWFKILEMLAQKEDHYLNCNNGKPTWEYLKARTGLSNERLNEMLDLFATVGAIDDQLWIRRIIWSQHFVDGIADVYKKRKVEIPIKPSFCDEKYSSAALSVPEGTQREEREEREKSKVKKREYTPPFLDFWNLYPRKEAKRRASKAFKNLTQKQIKKAMEVLPRHIQHWESTDSIVPHPATWLNGKRWEDQLYIKQHKEDERPAPKSIDEIRKETGY